MGLPANTVIGGGFFALIGDKVIPPDAVGNDLEYCLDGGGDDGGGGAAAYFMVIAPGAMWAEAWDAPCILLVEARERGTPSPAMRWVYLNAC